MQMVSPDVAKSGWPVLTKGCDWQWTLIFLTKKEELKVGIGVGYCAGPGVRITYFTLPWRTLQSKHFHRSPA